MFPTERRFTSLRRSHETWIRKLDLFHKLFQVLILQLRRDQVNISEFRSLVWNHDKLCSFGVWSQTIATPLKLHNYKQIDKMYSNLKTSKPYKALKPQKFICLTPDFINKQNQSTLHQNGPFSGTLLSRWAKGSY